MSRLRFSMVFRYLINNSGRNDEDDRAYYFHAGRFYVGNSSITNLQMIDLGGGVNVGTEFYYNQCLYLSLALWVTMRGADGQPLNLHERALQMRLDTTLPGQDIYDMATCDNISRFVEVCGVDVLVYDQINNTTLLFCAGRRFRPETAAYICQLPNHYVPMVLP